MSRHPHMQDSMHSAHPPGPMLTHPQQGSRVITSAAAAAALATQTYGQQRSWGGNDQMMRNPPPSSSSHRTSNHPQVPSHRMPHSDDVHSSRHSGRGNTSTSAYRRAPPHPSTEPGPLQRHPVAQTTHNRSHKEAPLYKLTVGLLSTYKQINKAYYEKNPSQRRKKPTDDDSKRKRGDKAESGTGDDDAKGDLILRDDELLSSETRKYKIGPLIGKGSFGQVVQATCIEGMQMGGQNKSVAIKIIKGKKAFFTQAQTEIKILQRLNQLDVSDKFGIVRMIDSFIHKNHQCIVFELLSQNLYDVIRSTKYKGVKLQQVRAIAAQVLDSLSFLSQTHVGVIHCDLKPENILLVPPSSKGRNSTRVKIIDFGSSCFTNKQAFSYIQSRFYRSPEVMLGMQYSLPIDCWSVGCILVEMLTGNPLFGGLDGFDQMYRICMVLGNPPDNILDQANKTSSFFIKDDVTKKYKIKPHHNQNSSSLKHETLEDIVRCGSRPDPRWMEEKECTEEDLRCFVDLIKALLHFDPKLRIKPQSALQHPFVKQNRSHRSSTSTSQITSQRYLHGPHVSNPMRQMTQRHSHPNTQTSRSSQPAQPQSDTMRAMQQLQQQGQQGQQQQHQAAAQRRMVRDNVHQPGHPHLRSTHHNRSAAPASSTLGHHHTAPSSSATRSGGLPPGTPPGHGGGTLQRLHGSDGVVHSMQTGGAAEVYANDSEHIVKKAKYP